MSVSLPRRQTLLLLTLSRKALFVGLLFGLALGLPLELSLLSGACPLFFTAQILSPLGLFLHLSLLVLEGLAGLLGGSQLRFMERHDGAVYCELLGCASLPVGLLNEVEVHQTHLLDEGAFDLVCNRLRLLTNDPTPYLGVSLQDIFHELVPLLEQHLFGLLWFTLEEENELVMTPVHHLVNGVLKDVLVLDEVLVLLLKILLLLFVLLVERDCGDLLLRRVLLGAKLLLRVELLHLLQTLQLNGVNLLRDRSEVAVDCAARVYGRLRDLAHELLMLLLLHHRDLLR